MSRHIAVNAINKDSWIMSFFIELKGKKDDTNLNTVIDIQNMEL